MMEESPAIIAVANFSSERIGLIFVGVACAQNSHTQSLFVCVCTCVCMGIGSLATACYMLIFTKLFLMYNSLFSMQTEYLRVRRIFLPSVVEK